MVGLPKLGKRARRPGDAAHRVRLSTYLDMSMEAPASCSWWTKVPTFGLYRNLELSTCGVAAPANLVRVWSAWNPPEVDLPEEPVLAAYTTLSGWDPAKPATDGGVVLTDMLNLWRSQGAGGIAGDVIDASAAVNLQLRDHVKLACALLGGVIVGLQLPRAVQGAGAWTMPSASDLTRPEWAPGSWGGHAVALAGYDDKTATVITWGGPLQMEWPFLELFGDEGFGAVSRRWLRRSSGLLTPPISPLGFDLEQLIADLALLG